jgi:acyl-coenzyme A thioesterase PaaI-like protein
MTSSIAAGPDRAAAQPANNDCCFACGAANPHGLGLRFAAQADGTQRAEWRGAPEWEGFPGVIHGGIVSTLLDEAMSKAVAAPGTLAMTCELRVRLRHHVASSEDLCVTGWIVETRRRRINAEASIMGRDGVERAHAWGTFLQTAIPAGSGNQE